MSKLPAIPMPTKAEAEAFTLRLRSSLDGSHELLVEAHDRQMWKAMEYKSWEAYVKAELGLGRRRSFQLIEEMRVIEAVRDATGDGCNTLHISARDAATVKPDLPAVAAEIKARVEAGEDPKVAKRAKLPADSMEHIRQRAIASEIDQVGMTALVQTGRLSTEGLDATAKGGARTPLLTSENIVSRNYGTETLPKALGFQPTKVARKRETEWAARRAGTAIWELQSRYYKRLARAIARDAEVDHIRQDIGAHNAQRPADQWIIIHGPSLRRAVRQELYGAEARDSGAPRKARDRMQEIRETRP